MSEVVELNFWHLVCTTEGCELAGISFPISGEEAECGGCNTMYARPE
jgi:hypothetical protein